MKKTLRIMAAVLAAGAFAACSSAEKMAQQAENVVVNCNPSVLEAVAGNIDAVIEVTYPKDYFHPKAILEVTPVLVYENTEAAAAPLMYQGEKVKDNYKVVPTAGKTVTERVSFEYAEGMEQSHLELRSRAIYKGRSVQLPVRKVADGVNTTYMLVKQGGAVSYKKDDYQAVLKQTAEGQILYNVNSADVQGKELRSKSIKDFQAALDEIKNNERKTLTGTEIVAYASPDGGKSLNDKLSGARSKSADKAWGTITKGKEVSAPEVKSVGQDWEGFQELVSKTDLADKDLILRVLSMYSDPAVRESEIKNMSEVYTALKSNVLPELRRARFIANVEYQNYTSKELLALVDENIDVLDEEALLRAARLVKDNAKKEQLYKKAVDKFGSDRAQYNLGVTYLNSGDLKKASKAFAKVEDKDGDLANVLGVVALRQGDLDAAKKYFQNAKTDDAKANLGVVDILTGDYDKAVQDLAGAKGCCHNTVLSLILTDQLDKAASTARCASPEVSYLRAIIAARQGNAAEVKKQLEAASANPAFAKRAAKDIEFADYNK